MPVSYTHLRYTMLTALLIICIPWLGLYGLCHELRARGQLHPDVGIAWILSSAGWSVLLVAIVEVTSAFQALNRATVAGAWVLAGLVLAGAALWLRWRRGAKPPSTFPDGGWPRSAVVYVTKKDGGKIGS